MAGFTGMDEGGRAGGSQVAAILRPIWPDCHAADHDPARAARAGGWQTVIDAPGQDCRARVSISNTRRAVQREAGASGRRHCCQPPSGAVPVAAQVALGIGGVSGSSSGSGGGPARARGLAQNMLGVRSGRIRAAVGPQSNRWSGPARLGSGGNPGPGTLRSSEGALRRIAARVRANCCVAGHIAVPLPSLMNANRFAS